MGDFKTIFLSILDLKEYQMFFTLSTVVWIYELEFWIAQGMWLGSKPKVATGQLEFIENWMI